MKKLLILMLLVGLGFGAVTEYKGNGWVEFDVLAEVMTSVNFVERTVYDIANFSSIDCTMNATNAITTGAVSWKMRNGTEVASETLTCSTPITNFESSIVSVRFNNPTVNITTINSGVLLFIGK